MSDDPANLGLPYIEMRGQSSLRPRSGGVKVSDMLYFAIGKFARSVSFTKKPCRPALRMPVFDIVGLGSYEQMNGVAAKRSIASVANAQTFRNTSVGHFVRKTVCFHLLPFAVWKSNPKRSVTFSGFSPSPNPTSVGFKRQTFKKLDNLHEAYLIPVRRN